MNKHFGRGRSPLHLVLGALASVMAPRIAPTASSAQTPSDSAAAQVRRPTRAERRQQLAAECASAAQWELHETAHYFLVVQAPKSGAHGEVKPGSVSQHEAFVAELKARVESLRRAVRAVFPRGDGDPNPIESAPNALRVCRDREAYYSYGGPGGTTGYWNPGVGELVIYDSASQDFERAATERSKTTWPALNKNLYFAYLAEFGRPSPPVWFHEGHASYFASFEFVDGEHVAARNEIALRARAQTPSPLSVEALVTRFSTGTPSAAREYFHEGHAQLGWALVWSLRQVTPALDGSTPSWSNALERWWTTWVDSRDTAAANAAAFAGVEWRELDQACAALLK